MELGFILLCFIGLALVFAFMHVMDKMASKRKFAMRRKRNGIEPFFGDSMTYSGHS